MKKIVIEGDLQTLDEFKRYFKQKYNYHLHTKKKKLFLVLYKNFVPLIVNGDPWTIKQHKKYKVLFSLISFDTIKAILLKKYDVWVSKNLYSVTVLISLILVKLRFKKFGVVVKEWFIKKNSFVGILSFLFAKYFTKYFIDYYLAYSTSTKEFLIKELGVKPSKIFLTPKSSDLNFDVKPKLTTKPTILVVARAVPCKAFENLFWAIESLKNEFKIEIVGDMTGKYGQSCICLAKKLKLDISFVGQVGKKKGSKEVEKYFNKADLFVLPNKFCEKEYEPAEVWGSVVDEALYFKLPVIVTTATGCAKDLVKNNYNGRIVEQNNVEQLRLTLKDYLNNPNKWKKMGSRGPEMLEHRNEVNNKGYKKFFEEVSKS